MRTPLKTSGKSLDLIIQSLVKDNFLIILFKMSYEGIIPYRIYFGNQLNDKDFYKWYTWKHNNKNCKTSTSY